MNGGQAGLHEEGALPRGNECQGCLQRSPEDGRRGTWFLFLDKVKVSKWTRLLTEPRSL